MNYLPLRAGPLSMLFDRQTAALRYVRLGRREIVRCIYGAVRDRNWDTIEPRLTNVHVEQQAGCFQVSFHAECRTEEIDFAWRGRITGDTDGTVAFRFEGAARRPFLKNRIGLCLLHPAALAGQRCRIEHADGSIAEGSFPRFVAPHQPFLDIRAIEHPVDPADLPGVSAEVRLEGESFEMEDQRNWTDGSFKTYSTPLALPFPVRMEAGQQVAHSVTIRLQGVVPADLAVAADDTVQARVEWTAARPKPPLGLGMATTGQPLTDQAADKLKRLGLDHLRIDIRPDSAAWRQRLAEGIDAAARCGCRLQVALYLTDKAESELAEFVGELAKTRPPVGLWLVYRAGAKATDAAFVDLARERLANFDPAIPLAAGTDAWFAELNRNRPPADSPAWPCYSITPQVHASDKLSIVETLEAQRSTAETARQFSPHPVVISAITLRPRSNPNATDPAVVAEPLTDPRQNMPFAAVWTLGTLAQLATHPHVGSLTFYETAGPRGVVSETGEAWPVYDVLAALAEAQSVCPASVDQPLAVAALGLVAADGRRSLLVANLTEQPQSVRTSDVKPNEILKLGPEQTACVMLD
jgi:D-apionolactonase